MKKLAFALIFAVLVMVNVNAKEVFYTNGIVELTEKEYNFVVDFYGEDYLKNMTQENYESISELDVNNREVTIKTAYDAGNPSQVRPYGTFVETEAKRLSIAGSCDDNYCTVIILAEWLGNPTVRSYDVMGARFQNTSLYNQNINTIVFSSAGNTYPTDARFLSNGFGISFKLPSSGSNIMIQQRYYVKPGGHVFASYQHAMSKTTLETSKLYNLSIVGYGGVFDFYGKADGKYDGMVGVDMLLK